MGMAPTQSGVVAAPVCGSMLSAISEPVVEVLEACGDALIEMQDTFIVARLLGKNAFGYEPSELEGKSILSILHPADHRPFVQTARALLAMAAGTPGVVTPPRLLPPFGPDLRGDGGLNNHGEATRQDG